MSPAPCDSDSDSTANTDEDPDVTAASTSTANSGSGRRPVWRERSGEELPLLDLPYTGNPPPIGAVKEPYEYFNAIFTEEIKQHLVNESNKYAIQVNPNKPLSLTKLEFEQFIGILYTMSEVPMRRTRLFWNKHCRYPPVADTMTINRFEQIKSKLHCNDNAEMPRPCQDKLYKIRPLFDMLNSVFNSTPLNEKLSIDEQVVPFKGKSVLKTYNPAKPKKWGYKIYVLSGADGIIYNMAFYTGSIEPVPGEPDLKASGNIVLQLMAPVQRGVWHKLYFDNWFTGVPLVTHLHKNYGIACLGTVRANRLPGCELPPDATMKKNGRGSMISKTTTVDGTELRTIRWYDNKAVTLLTTYAAVSPTVKLRRWDKKERQYVDIDAPAAIPEYNKFMGGVDKLDSLLAEHRIRLKSKKWYLRIIFHLLDTVVVQAWLLYSRDAAAASCTRREKLPLLDFKLSIAAYLRRVNKNGGAEKRGRPSMNMEVQLAAKARRGPAAPVPQQAIRTDRLDHWPMPGDKKGRCKRPGCKGTPIWKCSKCKVNLCLTPASNCFYAFHHD